MCGAMDGLEEKALSVVRVSFVLHINDRMCTDRHDIYHHTSALVLVSLGFVPHLCFYQRFVFHHRRIGKLYLHEFVR